MQSLPGFLMWAINSCTAWRRYSSTTNEVQSLWLKLGGTAKLDYFKSRFVPNFGISRLFLYGGF